MANLTRQFALFRDEKAKASELWGIGGANFACGHVHIFIRVARGAKPTRPLKPVYPSLWNETLLCAKCVYRLQKAGKIPKDKILTRQERKVAQAEVWLRDYLSKQNGSALLSAFTAQNGEKPPFGLTTLRTALKNLGGTEDSLGPRGRKRWRLAIAV